MTSKDQTMSSPNKLGPPRTRRQDQTVADADAVVAENAASLAADLTPLEPLWQTADQPDSDIVAANGVLHHRTTDQSGEPYSQITLPANRHLQVLQLAHSAPMAGVNRTKYKVLKNFFWPGIRQDITKFCKACNRCQQTVKHSSNKALVITAPLHDLATIPQGCH